MTKGETAMITAILVTKDGERIGWSGRPGNEQFLIRHETDFSKLSLLSEIDYDVFAASDMVELIGELMVVRKTVDRKDQMHIDEIITLAERCRDGDGLTLSFTPFD